MLLDEPKPELFGYEGYDKEGLLFNHFIVFESLRKQSELGSPYKDIDEIVVLDHYRVYLADKLNYLFR